MKRSVAMLFLLVAVVLLIAAVDESSIKTAGSSQFRNSAEDNAKTLINQGRHIFRFDTFGDEAFWTDALHMQQAVSTLSPQTALTLGLKVDAQALSPSVIQAIKLGRVNLADPAVTLALIKQNAVVGVVGTFDGDKLTRVGFTCALCHSTVDNSVAPRIGRRIDGQANHDLNVGAIVAAAPNLDPVVNLLRLAPQDASITAQDVRNVLQTWGPGRFDAELFLDGKAFNPQQITNGITTGTNVSGSTLIPNAYGLPGHNLHTWTGGWGTVSYWNAFVAVNELHGI